MKKQIKIAFAALACVCTLASCGTKVEYAKFSEAASKAAEARREVTVKKYVINSKGEIKAGAFGVTATVDCNFKLVYEKGENGYVLNEKESKDYDGKEAGRTAVEASILPTADMIGEDEDCTYYINSLGYKTKDGDLTEFNKYGYVTKISSKDLKVTVKYTISK
jgi:predicted small lipoprotein YifL